MSNNNEQWQLKQQFHNLQIEEICQSMQQQQNANLEPCYSQQQFPIIDNYQKSQSNQGVSPANNFNIPQLQLQKKLSLNEKIQNSLFKQNSLLQRWKNSDNIFKGKYKTGMTPSKKAQKNEKHPRKLSESVHKQYFNQINKASPDTIEIEIETTPKKINHPNPNLLQTPTSKYKSPNEKHSDKDQSPCLKRIKNQYRSPSIQSRKKQKKFTAGSMSIKKGKGIIDSNYFSCENRTQLDSNVKLSHYQKKIKKHEQIGQFNYMYERLSLIGKGHFGTVYRCRNKFDKQEYAIKIGKRLIRENVDLDSFALNEVQALASMDANNSPYITRYYKAWIEEGKLYLVMELCENSLKDQLIQNRQDNANQNVNNKYPSETKLKRVLHDIATGLASLHMHNIVHLDIKPENILYAKKKFKIADLGLSRFSKRNYGDDILEGDARYLAKEILNDIQIGKPVPDLTKADIFSLGISLYELMSGEVLPLNGQEWHDLRNGLFSKESLIMESYCYSRQLFTLVKQMMHIDPDRRPSAKQIIESPVLNVRKVELLKWEKLRTQVLNSQIKDCMAKIATKTQAMKANRKLSLN